MKIRPCNLIYLGSYINFNIQPLEEFISFKFAHYQDIGGTIFQFVLIKLKTYIYALYYYSFVTFLHNTKNINSSYYQKQESVDDEIMAFFSQRI